MTSTPFREQRAAFLRQLTELGAAAVVPTATMKVRNDDAHYPFRPSSDFWYLTGFAEPGACLVLLPERGPESPARSVLFLRERDREREIWDGRRLGLERAKEALGVDETRDIDALWDELPALLMGYPAVMWRFGDDPEADARMTRTFAAVRDRARGPVTPTTQLLDPSPWLHEMRVIKSEAERAHMRRAAEITARAHADLMAHLEPGMNECEALAFLHGRYLAEGCTGAAYGHICAGGENACILHYVENDMPLRDGDLILVDSGAEWSYYAADITRTFPVNGTFTEDQKALYQVVLDAEVAAIEVVRPGVSFEDVHRAALAVLVDGLLELGLLAGTRESVIEEGSYRAFFMHKTSHWLGLDVHDCGSYVKDGEPRPLEPGMVLTIEPGIYVASDNEDVEERWRGIGIRIEDDVLVTEAGHEVLTAAAPKSVEDVEAACRAARSLAAAAASPEGR